MIHFLPHMEFTISSNKTPEEMHRIMEAETKIREGWFFYSSVDEDFIGVVEETSFEVEPKLPFGIWDSFVPMIVGQIQPQGSGAKVDIRMRLRWDALFVSVVLFSMLGLYFAFCLLALIAGMSEAWKEAAGAAGMILLMQLMARGGFYLPARMAKRKLVKLLGDS